ncbi:LPS assembly lipoprotein LptE [Agaribacterium haliotis]|uniref:LPS-assembly lipoprotein LptE n=1 Tax=Agaribacterium haliotis TaxID=2013869 RepID=UPI00130422A0|nr:LPS assembly lipoprotein LptE [Agaribacterium haliotis]
MALALLLSSCGWQVRGAAPGTGVFAASALPELDALELSSDSRNSAFYRSFLTTMTQRGIRLGSDSGLYVQLGRERLDRKPLSYASSGAAAQYQITMRMQYQVNQNATTLIEQREITARRNYDFDPEQIIAKDREQQELITEMRQQLVEQILSSIQRAL